MRSGTPHVAGLFIPPCSRHDKIALRARFDRISPLPSQFRNLSPDFPGRWAYGRWDSVPFLTYNQICPLTLVVNFT